ncbi:MAG: hypothetical protein ABIE84_05050 [bacterium]
MNNLAITAIMPQVKAESSVAKTESSSQTSFLTSFAQLSPSQVTHVPGSLGEESIDLWNHKLEKESKIPSLEELLEEKVEDLSVRIAAILDRQEA